MQQEQKWVFIRDGVTLWLPVFLGNCARCAASAPLVIISKQTFTWALTVVEDSRVVLFHHFYIRSDSQTPVHFVAPRQSRGLLHGRPICMNRFDALVVHRWAKDWICRRARDRVHNWVGGRLAAELGVATWQSHGFLSLAELGIGSTLELGTGPTTELGDVSQRSWELPHGRAMGSYPRQSWGLGPQQSWGLCVAEPWCLLFNWVGDVALWTLAPRDQGTCYQARGLSGHTSPCVECTYLVSYYFILDPGTTWSSYLLSGSGTKWAHFTLQWMCLSFFANMIYCILPEARPLP
jgi:hypothetical protein